jgi:hypothetical protein
MQISRSYLARGWRVGGGDAGRSLLVVRAWLIFIRGICTGTFEIGRDSRDK